MRKTRKESILTGRLQTRRVKASKGISKAGTGKAGTSKAGTGKGVSAASKSSTETIVPTFLHMLNTVKLYHWKTMSYSTHKATDELYGSLNEKIDHFVEVMLGKKELGGRAKLLHVHMIKLTVFSNNEAFIKQIESYKKFLLNMTNDPVLGAQMNTDLLAIRDEILADFNKFLYLLSLGG
jgi:hypothetical protein